MAEVSDSVEFLPGFTKFRGTSPGGCLEIENCGYTLTFAEVLFDGKRSSLSPKMDLGKTLRALSLMTNRSSIISHLLENFYNWTYVMDVLLASLENVEDFKTSEEFVVEELESWMFSYSGWGLVSALLPRQQDVYFKQALRVMKQNWPLQEEFSEERCWAIFFEDKDMEAIIPEIEVTIKEGNFGSEAGRQKWINLNFISANVEVKFMSVKKQKMEKGNLVAIAAAAVAKQLQDVEDIDHLEIPSTLMKHVSQMIEDRSLDKGLIPKNCTK